MNRLLAATSSAVLLALAACSGGAGVGDQSAALVKAGQALEAKVGAPGQNAQMPGADDPDVKAFNAEAEKGLTALGTASMPVDGLNSYDRLCGSAAKITAAYVSAGLGAMGPGGLPMNDQAKVAKMTENANRYMGQMFVPVLYSAHCTAVHLPSVDKALSSQDTSGKVAAMAQIRNGAYGQATGLLQMAASADIGSDKRKTVLDLLLRDAGNFGLAFNRVQRQQFGQMADQAAQISADAKPQIDKIKAAVDRAPCGKLCSS
jgi:hypothetical protein